MLLKCDLVIINRLAPSVSCADRKCHATFVLGRQKKKNQMEEIIFTLFTTKNKVGSKYKVVDNVLKVHNRFVNDGLCTLSIKEPPQDLAISKADVITLKKFLHILRQALKKDDTSNIAELENVLKVKNCDIEKPKAKLSVLSRASYPLKAGFPSSLENLVINGCNLQKFDSRILKLRHLNTLDVSRNKLNALCDSLDSLVSLRCLYLSENAFETVPLCVTSGETSKRLRHLDLSLNRIKYIPSSISSLKELHTFKLNSNSIISIPHTFGLLKELRRLELNGNLITCLPWSFSKLKLDYLDVSANKFHEMKIGLVDNTNLFQIPDPPTLYELCCRVVVREKIRPSEQLRLPRHIQRALAITRYCPCGVPCISKTIPFVTSFDATQVTQTLSYDMTDNEPLKLMTSLCSRRCYRMFDPVDPNFKRSTRR